jgi:UDP-N-acetylmuramate dehydrogenase
MLIVPDDPDCRSAGSFFKNPVVAQALYDEIAARSVATVPSFPAARGFVKIPAAWLLEKAGFVKGYSQGRAGISSRHTLALINRGGASASEIISLRDRIIETVRQKFGITLEPEPVWVE